MVPARPRAPVGRLLVSNGGRDSNDPNYFATISAIWTHALQQTACMDAMIYSITSSARASEVGGTERPSALAVVRLMTRSNFVEVRRMRVCYPSRPSARIVSCTFGLAPIRAMYALMFGHFARSILWILVQLSTVHR